jgi:hypothetical protein
MCGICLVDGDDTYEVALKSGATGDNINGTDHSSNEWSRLFIAGEIVIFRCVDAAGPHWIVWKDGRIPCTGWAYPSSAPASDAIVNTWTIVEHDTTDVDTGGCFDSANNRFVARRDGVWDITASTDSDDVLNNGKEIRTQLRINNTSVALGRQGPIGAATSVVNALTNSLHEMSNDDYLDAYYLMTEGSRKHSATKAMTHLTFREVLGIII